MFKKILPGRFLDLTTYSQRGVKGTPGFVLWTFSPTKGGVPEEEEYSSEEDLNPSPLASAKGTMAIS